jgi:hypothetical protein
MTKFETIIFNMVESTFGREAAIKNYSFWINTSCAFMYMGYTLTLPFRFVKLVWKKLKEKGVI